ncbi:MAG: hypothetical protein AAF668_03225 [Pseudomonadota bacterium]
MNVKQVNSTYVARGGDHLNMDLKSPELKEFVQNVELVTNWCPRLSEKINGVISIVKSGLTYDKEAQQAEYKANSVAPKQSDGNILFQEVPVKNARLGHLLKKNALVCREKSILTHLALANLGVPTVVQPGTIIKDGDKHAGHAWVEWIEPASARGKIVHAFIDGTCGLVYTNYHYDDRIAERLESSVFFEPIVARSPEEIAVALGECSIN